MRTFNLDTLENGSSKTSATPDNSGEIPWDIPTDTIAERGIREITDADGICRTQIARIGAPSGQEATSTLFYCWSPDGAPIEATQIVRVSSLLGGRNLTHFGLIEEVYRTSRRRNMGQEVDEHDGRLGVEPEFAAEGITYAKVAILRSIPPVLAPPRERSAVCLASAADASLAYGSDEMGSPLAIGLIKNGADNDAGPGYIDTDYLLGANGGHMNVNGAAGRGTKSSFLMTAVSLLIHEAVRQASEKPNDPDRLRVVPIVFNVKGYDLFYIDRQSRIYDATKHVAAWQTIGVKNPGPFTDVTYLAPQQPGNGLATAVGRGDDVLPYSWGLLDIVSRGLLLYLFSDEDANNDNFSVLIQDIEARMTTADIIDGIVSLRVTPILGADGQPITTFDQLLAWLTDPQAPGFLGNQHVAATIRKVARRLQKLLLESRGVLRRAEAYGNPLEITRGDTCSPIVIDLTTLTGASGLQRFVVATVLRQLIDAQTGVRAVRGLKYLVVIDELNRFAPRGHRDPITRLIEMVAAEMRSQGVLLFGAQQQASKVSETVIENAGVRAIGKTGMLELSNTVWRALSEASKVKADALPPGEKMILQDNFRQPLHIRMPFPPWAMNPREAAPLPLGSGSARDESRRAQASAIIDRD